MNPTSQAIASNRESFAFIGPELVLVVGILGLLLFASAGRRPAVAGRHRLGFTLGALGVVAAALVALFLGPGSEPAALFNGLLVNDPFSWFFRLFALSATALVIPIVPGSEQIPEERMGEFYALLLSITVGLLLLPAATDLVMIFLALELVSLMSYVLTGWRQGVPLSVEGALKYVIYGGVASGTMLYGFSLLYGLGGGTSLVELHEGISVALAGGAAFDPMATRLMLAVAMVFVLVGFGYKIAAAPFHMWSPDAYEGAPTPFTAFLSVGPKAAGLALMIRFFFGVFSDGTPTAWADGAVTAVGGLPWPEILGILAIATMTVGNVTALVQTSLKRMLAFSSIAHAGYMLMGLATATTVGIRGVLLYAIVYLFMNLGAFTVVTAVETRTGSDHLDGFRGLSKRAPLGATMLAIFLFSLTGLPPFAGFIGKVYLFYAVIMKGGTFMWILALVGALNSAVSLFYYAKVVKTMFLDQPVDTAPVRLGRVYDVMAVAFAVPTLVFGLWWSPLARASDGALVSAPLQALAEAPTPGHHAEAASDAGSADADEAAALADRSR